MRIFVDVGAHFGESFEIAFNPAFGFEKYFLIEPSSKCLKVLRKIKSKKVTVVPVGFSKVDSIGFLFNSGNLGASIYQDKPMHSYTSIGESIELVSTSKWLLSNTTTNDQIYMKLNCEGGEADIIEDLIEHDYIRNITSLYVDFDIRKIPSQAYRLSFIQEKLRSYDIEFYTQDDVTGLDAAAINSWLSQSILMEKSSWASRIVWKLKFYLPVHRQIYIFLRTRVPKKIVRFIKGLGNLKF